MPPISILALVLSGIAAVPIGFVWYGPLFGRPWMKTIGLNMDTMTPEAKAAGMKQMPRNIAISVASTVLMAYVLNAGLAFANAYLNTSGLGANLMGAFWYWLGFTATALLIVTTWEGKPWKNFFIHVGYYFVLLMVIAAIITYA